MFIGRSRKSILFMASMSVLVITYSLMLLISNSDLLVATPIMAAPLAQNSYSECPPNSSNIWVRLDDNNFNGQSATLSIPFDSGQVTIGNNIYINYLLGVLISEVAPTADFDPVDDETLKAMAIAARTVAYKNCGLFVFDGHRGIDDDDKQVYDPRKRDLWLNSPSLGQAELDRYQQAVDDTAGMYLTYSGSVFDAQYRDISKNPTSGTTEPHLGVVDPAGDFHSTSPSQLGLPQINSNHWATGENHGENLTPWNYRQILTHYYTGIHIRNASNTILTPEYRWNPLEVSWANPTFPIVPPPMTPNVFYSVNMVFQNTGSINWSARLAYQWRDADGTIIGSGSGVSRSLSKGGSSPFTFNAIEVHAPATPGVYTLIIDMQVNIGGTYEFFFDREAGRPWYPLVYTCEVGGGECTLGGVIRNEGDIFLPIILKNA